MTKFRGCIDIHSGMVKQIVGGTLKKDDTEDSSSVSTNFISSKPSSFYANLYKEHNINGCHVIKLGSLEANDKAAEEAISVWPNHLQIGGGITDQNAQDWLNKGASHVIITSWLFPGGKFDKERLISLSQKITPAKLVIDLSCRKKIVNDEIQWIVAMNKWQTLTDTKLSKEFFNEISVYCSEFLVHAADVEGLCNGIDEILVSRLSEWCNIPITYAGGAKGLDDLKLVENLSGGKVDLTYGSALDFFGGSLVKFDDLSNWNKTH